MIRIAAFLTLLVFALPCRASTVHLAPPGVDLHVPEGEAIVRHPAHVENHIEANPQTTQVIVYDGEYVGSFSVDTPAGVDPAAQPLLIRAADGATPVFRGSVTLENAEPVDGEQGLWSMPYQQIGAEMVKVWDPTIRVRYRYVADLAAVKFFPATFTVQAGRLYLRVHGDSTIDNLRRNHAYIDYGIFIRRPHTTVRGLTFRDFRKREKWSTPLQIRADHAVVENCTAINSSIGFTVQRASGVTVRGCRAEDVGCGVYVGAQDTTVENCQLFKVRDRFQVPMYHQDDCGIQYYYPAKGGVIRGNLCVGFKRGIFIKAYRAPYIIEHNTIDGVGECNGFGVTKWSEGQRFRYNILANCRTAMDTSDIATPAEVHHNAIFHSQNDDDLQRGVDWLEADPQFAALAARDYRLQNDSPCLGKAPGGEPYGALGAIGDDAPLTDVVTPNDDPLDIPHDNALQARLDAAEPGDEIILEPGIYPHGLTITRSGTAEKPIVLRAAEKWKAILDGNRAVGSMIHIKDAAHIVIRNLEIRWYGGQGIYLENASDITVDGCRIWNAPWWGSWPIGKAIRAEFPERLTVTRCVMWRQEHGVYMHNGTGAVITHNTAVANLYGAVTSLGMNDVTCVNNNFPFQGNDVIRFEHKSRGLEKIGAFDCDYNNYGTTQRHHGEGVAYDSIEPREHEKFLAGGSKAVAYFKGTDKQMQRFLTLDAWRAHTGLDQHTLFVDPLFVDAANYDFRLQPDSPLISAGRDGTTIGALGAADK